MSALPPESPGATEDADITGLLQRWAGGDAAALDQLMPIVYQRMRRLAHVRLRTEGDSCSLDTTALVHEAYLKLVTAPGPTLQNRGHFLGLASRVMRHLLVDHARARRTAKRGGTPIPLTEPLLRIPQPDLDAVADLDEALERLEKLDPRQAQILEQHFFGGLSLEETAEALGISVATVKRELRAARAWLATALDDGSKS